MEHCRRMVDTCRAYIIQQIDLFQTTPGSAASGQQMRGILHCSTAGAASSGAVSLLSRRCMPSQSTRLNLEGAVNGPQKAIFSPRLFASVLMGFGTQTTG